MLTCFQTNATYDVIYRNEVFGDCTRPQHQETTFVLLSVHTEGKPIWNVTFCT